ncbi:MAG TPA: YiiD C-terminal domain-containing protein, partial [Longimicrobiales bacterium]|nr:YiiD C-terminal domain-containing protein [Longimicrobiales bacterium]
AEIPNTNLHGTMFGGSIAALGLLAGWGLVRLGLRQEGIEPDVVVQRTLTEYVKPVEGDAVAIALTPDPGEWARFLKAVRRRKRGRILLEIQVRGVDSETPDTVMDAWFVAVDKG